MLQVLRSRVKVQVRVLKSFTEFLSTFGVQISVSAIMTTANH